MVSQKSPIVSREEWMAARMQLLTKEKALTHQYDRLMEERRKMPWVEMTKGYVFQSPEGEKSLADLFDGRSQLFLYHFMLGPEMDEGCKSCSFFADHVEGFRVHIENHDVKFVAVSRAQLPKIEEFKERMGWNFDWVSSADSDFNFDFHVSFTPEEVAKGRGYYNWANTEIPIAELPGVSVFVRDESGRVFHTYSAYARGLDILLGAHNVLDFTPKGRNEVEAMDWVRHHDRYDVEAGVRS